MRWWPTALSKSTACTPFKTQLRLESYLPKLGFFVFKFGLYLILAPPVRSRQYVRLRWCYRNERDDLTPFNETSVDGRKQ